MGVRVSYILHILSLLVLSTVPKQGQTRRLKAINPDRISVFESSKGVHVLWNKTRDKKTASYCYNSHLQYRSNCDTGWQNVFTKQFDYTIQPDRKKKYDFKIRMRYDSVCMPLGNNWTTWGTTISWGNTETGSCIKERVSQVDTRLYLLTILPLCLCFLLVCTVMHNKVKRLFLPVIPDPKHSWDHLFKMEEIQWFGHDTEPSRNCETVDIEIIDSERNNDEEEEEQEEEKKKRVVETNPEDESRTTGLDAGLSDTGLGASPTLLLNGAYIGIDQVMYLG